MADTTTAIPYADDNDGANIRFQADAVSAGEQIATDGCTLKTLVVTSTVAQWVQVHNVASAPADAVVPVLSIYVAANGMASVAVPIYLDNGLYICNSSTHGTKTIGAADCMIYGTFKD